MKTGIDWKRKLTSRKWWSSIATFISMIIIACGGGESTSVKITAIIMAGASMIGYTIGEGLADKSNKEEYEVLPDAIGFEYTEEEEEDE